MRAVSLRGGVLLGLVCAALAVGCNKNKGPTAVLTVDPNQPHAGIETLIDGSASHDSDGRIVDYKFEFGDGTTSVSGQAATVNHTFMTESPVVIRLTVTDNKGAKDTAELSIGVANDAPTVQVAVSPNPANKFETVTFDASASSDFEGEVINYTFEFGDGQAITQLVPIVTHEYDVVNFQDTTYNVVVKAFDELGKEGRTTVSLLVKDLPPSVSSVDPGADGRGVIGEWVKVIGKNIFTPPTITVDGVVATDVVVLDEFSFEFRVPPRTRSGIRNLGIVWEGYDGFYGQLDVRRYVTVSSGVDNKVYFMDVNGNETVTVPGLQEAISDAARVKISPDGSTAYIADGRWSLNSTGTITIVDLTADGGPALVGTMQVGLGPLFDLEVAAKSPMMVAMDIGGYYLYDITDPQSPSFQGYFTAVPAGGPAELAATDMAVSPDGSRIVVLNSFVDEARVFNLNGFTVMNAANPSKLPVGVHTQDVVISPDGNYALVLGGGGEGAFPPDFSSGSDTSVTVLDISGTAAVGMGSYNIAAMAGSSIAPLPYDLVIGPDSGILYVVTLNETLSDLFDLIDQFLNTGDPALLVQIIVMITGDGINFGSMIPINDPTDPALASLGTPVAETLTAPTSADILFSDGMGLATSFRLWWDNGPVIQRGYSYLNLNFGVSTYTALEPQEDLSLDALFNLLQGLLITGDVSIQP